MAVEKRYPKGEIRKEAILRAGIDIACEQGFAAVTHRAVTQRAGVPYTSVSYFFGSIERLSIEVVQRAADDLAARLDGLTDQLTQHHVSPSELADAFAQLLVTFPANMELARYEVLLHLTRSQTHQETLTDLISKIEQTAEAALRAGGARRPAQGARAFAAMAEGFNLHHIAAPRPDDVRDAANAYRALFFAFVMDDDELSHWHERLEQRSDPEG